ncbi:MAG: hypothetical protein WCY29_06010 [Novosphingobium sp.]
MSSSAVEIVRAAGWEIHFIDDGYGPTGWWACKGLFSDPELETGIFDTEEDAATVALQTWPHLFA